MAKSVTFDQAVEFLGKVLGVIAGALEGLRHEQNLETHRIASVVGDKMALKQRVTDAIKITVTAENLSGFFDIK